MILIPLVAVSGCLSDDNADKWNEIVDRANGYSQISDDLITDAENAYYDGYYDLAIEKADDAIDEMNLLAYEVNNLKSVAEDMDKDFAEDYVLAWQRRINAVQSYVENLKMLAYIDMYVLQYMDILDLQVTALDEMIDFMDYYNAGQYQQAMIFGQMARTDFQTLSTYARELADVADNIPYDYVQQYVAAGTSLFDSYVSFLENGLQAASSLLGGDNTSAAAYESAANDFLTTAGTAQDIMNAIAESYPLDFPDDVPDMGYPLDDLYSQYYYAWQSDIENINKYADEMTDIEDENDDFFE